MSKDFVTAISRLRGYRPRETTVQFINPKSVFARSLHDTMRKTGYGIQLVGEDESSSNLITYVSEKYETSLGTTVAYEITVGAVKLGREYEVRGDRIFPIAALSVRGATSDHNGTVDNGIFSDAQGQDDSEDWLPADTSDEALRRPRQGSRFSQRQKNVAEIGASNFSSLLSNYDPIRSETLVFPYDSLRLSKANRKVLSSVADQYDPQTDVISIIGCSHGSTKLENGNALLAVGRAGRVKEELMALNISPESLFDEGCWSAAPYKDMPSRGVVVTLQTRASAG